MHTSLLFWEAAEYCRTYRLKFHGGPPDAQQGCPGISLYSCNVFFLFFIREEIVMDTSPLF